MRVAIITGIALTSLVLSGKSQAQFHTTSYQPGFTTDYTVQLNKSQLVRLPESAAAVIVGNPNIADVSVHSNTMVFLLGRGYGETNLIVLNSSGDTIVDTNVKVTAEVGQGRVRVHQSGVGRSTYSCHPYCLPAPTLGDNPEFSEQFRPEPNPVTSTVATGTSSVPSEFVGAIVEDGAPPSSGLHPASDVDH